MTDRQTAATDREPTATSVSPDAATAAAFADSWRHCFSATPYTREQFLDWIAPLRPEDLAGRTLCELGCGSGGLLAYAADLVGDGSVTGVELGEAIGVAVRNLGDRGVMLVRDDLIAFSRQREGAFEVVYSIGVLHHMESPRAGLEAVVRATAPGGRWHCWVYGHEGNGVVRWIVDPLRRVASRLPWWLNKYFVAGPLAVPLFLAARLAVRLPEATTRYLPLGAYLRWIGRREFAFHHHVAFDQLVSPTTHYLRREEIESWLVALADEIEETYLLARNGNSWKFGGRRRDDRPADLPLSGP